MMGTPMKSSRAMHALVVSSEQGHRRSLAERLVAAGFTCHCVADAREALLGTATTYDVVLSDRALQPAEASSLIDEGTGAPTRRQIIVTGLDPSQDLGLQGGLAKLLGVLGRAIEGNTDTGARQVCFGLALDSSAMRAVRDGIDLHLTPTEYRVLECLAKRVGHVVSRQTLCDEAWSREWYGLTNVVDVYVSRVRRKVDGTFSPRLVHTVRGVGYRLGPPCGSDRSSGEP